MHERLDGGAPFANRKVMNTPVKLALIAVFCAGFAGCATEEEIRRRDAQRAREDAREEAEDRRRDAQREEEDWQDFLEDYAHSLGKAKSELTSAQRAEARQMFKRGDRPYGRHRYHYWY
jgi:hypothetical protein